MWNGATVGAGGRNAADSLVLLSARKSRLIGSSVCAPIVTDERSPAPDSLTVMSADQSFGLAAGDGSAGAQTEAQQMLDAFWPKVVEDIERLNANDFKSQELPLARIKKIMKLDDDVKAMVSL